MSQARLANTLRVVIFYTSVLLAIFFVAVVTNSSVAIVLAQMHNMTMPTSAPIRLSFSKKQPFLQLVK